MNHWGLSPILIIILVLKVIKAEFVKTNGVQFTFNGIPFYVNGFNAYWLMDMASDPTQRFKVNATFEQAQNNGLFIARTWAFSDGGSQPLQSSPGVYDEKMFKGLDYVISVAGNYGIKLILSLVNNHNDYGGKQQYMKWAYPNKDWSTENATDQFFTDSNVKGFYMNHIKAVLTRNNTISGVTYKDDSTIMAWELMNEARCTSNVDGYILRNWIADMAAYLKHIDPNHLLEVGLEGFYGPSNANKNQGVSFYEVGTDFITNNQNSLIDFATIHAYPSTWLENGSSDEEQVEFLRKWIEVHIDDAQNTLKKPMLLAEFGKSDKDSGFTVAKRDILMRTAYAAVYSSAQAGGAAAGSLFWQIMTEGAEDFEDGYEIFLSRTSSTTDIIFEESQRLAKLRGMYARLENVKEWKNKNKNKNKGASAREIHGNGNGN